MGGYIERVSGEIADILLREGIDYVQTKAVFKAARAKAGLKAPKERRTAPARLTIEEQLRFIDAAYARDGPVGLMVQTLLETGTRVSEFVALRVEDVSLGERMIVIENGKGGKAARGADQNRTGPSAVHAHREAEIRTLVRQPREGRRRVACLFPPAHRADRARDRA